MTRGFFWRLGGCFLVVAASVMGLAAQPLQIAVILPFSGQHAASGQAQRAALEAYVRRNPDVYSIPFDLTFLDSQSNPARAVQFVCLMM